MAMLLSCLYVWEHWPRHNLEMLALLLPWDHSPDLSFLMDFKTKTISCWEFSVRKSFVTDVHSNSSSKLEFWGSKTPWKQSA